MFTVYLAGSIQCEREEFCRGWRKDIIKRFEKYEHIKFLNPIEGKDLSAEYDPKVIFETDIDCINQSDIVVVEMAYEDYHYIGSSIEIYHAWRKNIPVIIWGSAHKDHYFLKYLSEWRVENKEQAIDMIFEKYHNWCQVYRELIQKEEEQG